METKDKIEIAALLLASVGGLLTALLAVAQMFLNRLQRIRELRWQQAREAKVLLSELTTDPKASDAMQMLDWDGRKYEVSPGQIEKISKSDLESALRTSNLKFTGKESFIRDCIDRFLDGLEQSQHFIEISLIHFSDVEAPLGYYIGLLANRRALFESYMDEYSFLRAKRFCERYEAWKSACEE